MQNQNKLAKQIINQATKTKQILLNTSIKLLTLISILTLNNYLCAMVPGNTDQTKSDRMAKLAKRAEDMYAASSAEKAADKVPTPVITPAPKAATIKTAKLESDKSEPGISGLDKHGNITDDFWKELSQCKKCPPPSERIDCKKILRDNPAWQKVVPMDRATKKVIMHRALNYFRSQKWTSGLLDTEICLTSCAVCAGADPNQTTGTEFTKNIDLTALRNSYWSNAFGLSVLLIEKGASINENYEMWPHPCNFFYPSNWRDELTKHGHKCTEELARLRDGR